MKNEIRQGRILIGYLRSRPHTYLEMLGYGVSSCPWKRVIECLALNEWLVKTKNRKGLTLWRVRRGTLRAK